MALLADALNRCWLPYFPGQPPMTPAAFRRSIRDLQVWCSSCMVAFAGADPIGVLIGAKRPSGTLIHRIAVHPDHRRQGHGRHMLASLGSKLAILGPPRLVAEVPEALAPARGLFEGSGYVRDVLLTDYVLAAEASPPTGADLTGSPRPGQYVIPVTVDDLAANGLLPEPDAPVCWARAVATLTARKEEIAGLAIASDEGIEACLLYIEDEIVLLRSLVDDGGARLGHLLSRLRARVADPLRFLKVHPGEIPQEILQTFGFRADGVYGVYTATARAA